MTRKNESEEERQKKIREAKRAGRSPSEAGATRGASEQPSHESRGGHPEQKTTHPVRD